MMRNRCFVASPCLAPYLRAVRPGSCFERCPLLNMIWWSLQEATSLGAVFQFFLRDMTGMVGGVLFASLQGSTFDAYAKQWRLFADCLNNVGALPCSRVVAVSSSAHECRWVPCRASTGAAFPNGASPLSAFGISWQRSSQHHRCANCKLYTSLPCRASRRDCVTSCQPRRPKTQKMTDP